MAVELDFAPRFAARFGEQRHLFGSSLHGSGLESSRAIAHAAFCDQEAQLRQFEPAAACAVAHPRQPWLDRMPQAQGARQYIRGTRGIHHQHADQVVGEQIDPQLLLDHRGRLACQRLHAERRLDATQIELDVPAALVEILQFGFWGSLRAQQARGGPEGPGSGLTIQHFVNEQGLR